MIIKAPTGLYRSILPRGTEAGNISYTISSQDPPRPFINISQLPVIEELTPAPDKIFDDETRRNQFGELIFTIAHSNKNIAGSNAKTFSVGEVLAFDILPPSEELVTVRSPDDVEVQHNTNLLDLSKLGLTDDEIVALAMRSSAKQVELEKLFVNKQNEIKHFEVEIGEVQKTINENNKTLNAVMELLGLNPGETSDNVVFQKLSKNVTDLQTRLDTLITNRNAAATEVAEIHKSIIKISELVR